MRVVFHEADRLEYLAALGLVPDATITVCYIRRPSNGPLQLQLGREYRIIGFNLAETSV
jgi:Fe2+ transport system protein FeoA